MVSLFTLIKHEAAVNSSVVSVINLVHFITASQKTWSGGHLHQMCKPGIKSGFLVTGVSGPGIEASLWMPATFSRCRVCLPLRGGLVSYLFWSVVTMDKRLG